MRMRFWLRRTGAVFGLALCALFTAELLKGHAWQAALRFAAMWSAISTAVFIGWAWRAARSGASCPMCREE